MGLEFLLMATTLGAPMPTSPAVQDIAKGTGLLCLLQSDAATTAVQDPWVLGAGNLVVMASTSTPLTPGARWFRQELSLVSLSVLWGYWRASCPGVR